VFRYALTVFPLLLTTYSSKMDDSGDRKLDREDVKTGLTDYGIPLTGAVSKLVN